jgi:inorganic pyrophosphatase
MQGDAVGRDSSIVIFSSCSGGPLKVFGGLAPVLQQRPITSGEYESAELRKESGSAAVRRDRYLISTAGWRVAPQKGLKSVKTPHFLLIVLLPFTVAAQDYGRPPAILPASATTALVTSLKNAAPHSKHVWRDTPPTNSDDTVNAYIEIAIGDRRKWEFDMRANARAIDRMIPEDIGGYPVNYGFVPQTVSYDGDPFDALVLGPPLPDGQLVRGLIVGVMYMEDEKGLDSKVVLSPVGSDGRPLHSLTSSLQQEIGGYFARYKQQEPGGFSKVPGWGPPVEGRAYITTTHAFFRDCRARAGTSCALKSLTN